jgi:hypothetical protein
MKSFLRLANTTEAQKGLYTSQLVALCKKQYVDQTGILLKDKIREHLHNIKIFTLPCSPFSPSMLVAVFSNIFHQV